MSKQTLPIPENELKRVLNLAEFDIDYSNIENNFKDLATLAAKIAGTEISLINLIDSFTQWTIANKGLVIDQMPREESVCQYTILHNDSFEVADLSSDERFKDKFYVTGPLRLKYYMGVPLTTSDGFNIGALCVIDTKAKSISPEKLELLKIVADEVVGRLKTLKTIDSLRSRLVEAKETQKKVAHDIRGPIAGIIGLAGLIEQQGADNDMEEVLESMMLIRRSASTVLELANEIFTENNVQPVNGDEFNLLIFKDKLEQLYLPQAKNKGVNFLIKTSERTKHIPFSKNKLLQIAGNLLYNAIKFTPKNGSVNVELDLKPEATYNLLKIKVVDSGVGIDGDTLANILEGNTPSSAGTSGEKGFGFGLSLVKTLIESLNGEFRVRSYQGHGATFEVLIRQSYQ